MEKQIAKIKDLALNSEYESEKIKCIDTLAFYKEAAIDAIIEISNSAKHLGTKIHALNTIMKLKWEEVLN